MITADSVCVQPGAGIHQSSSVRFAIPGDFQQDRPTIVPVDGPGHRSFPDDTPEDLISEHKLEWQMDVATFCDDGPPQEDMWANWRI